jgi:hypothetical protein
MFAFFNLQQADAAKGTRRARYSDDQATAPLIS